MQKKRILSILAAAAILTAAVFPAYADQAVVKQAVVVQQGSSGTGVDESSVKISRTVAKNTAVKFLKDYFDIEITDKYETNMELREDYPVYGFLQGNRQTVWELNFQRNDNVSSSGASVCVDANSGKVVSVRNFQYSFRSEEPPKVAAITQEQARKAAESFLKKVNPEESAKLQLDEKTSSYGYGGGMSAQYPFNFIRVENGLKFYNNGAAIEVDGTTGKVTSYTFSWSDDASFPEKGSAMDPARALELMTNAAEMKLFYIPYFDNRNYAELPGAVKLVYGIGFPDGSLLDAVDGKMLQENAGIGKTLKVKDLTESEKRQLEQKWKAVPQLDREMDDTAAAELIKARIEELFGKDYEVNSIRYEENSSSWGAMGKNVWTAQFSKKDSNTPYNQDSGTIAVDAATGQLIWVSKYNFIGMQDTSEFTPKLTWEEAYGKAVDLAAAYFPDKVRNINTRQRYIKQYSYVNGKKMPERTYYFNFPRMENNVPYQNDGISVEFDIKTGKVTSLRCSWSDKLKFPGVQGILDKEAAKQAYFKLFVPELVYGLVDKSGDPEKPEMEVKLVYRLAPQSLYSTSGYMDAFTGKALDFTGRELDEEVESFKQAIKGHWAEKELQILSYQGIIDVHGFQPDKGVTKMEAAKILVNAKGYQPYLIRDTDGLKFNDIAKDSENYKYLQLAVEYGIIDNTPGDFKGDEIITREDMAELLVRLLQYNKIAKLQGIFSPPFKDAGEISPDKYGYVAVGKGLGILNGSDGNFRPRDQVTAAEFAVAVYNALGTLKNPE
ncbi:MAG: S-layer homology domain-containing protein [Clostridiales bacterium]|jgi:hypothetical protein|nr:S-layer homology domain-containing protein [Eubacteriales bacterium]MDH7567582.1 S-layer homology domain-containing protein [Clostridiales bacterium]